VTSLEKLCRANRWRIRQTTDVRSRIASSDSDGWNGVFIVPLEGEFWNVQIADGAGWKHLSVSNAQKKVMPSWNIMARLKDLFFGDDEWAVAYFPARQDYVNDHPFCLHVWAPLNETLPKPPVVLV
jgi:hypothetical protein